MQVSLSCWKFKQQVKVLISGRKKGGEGGVHKCRMSI